MSIVLPLIDDLHSPAMRDRHWMKLAHHCQVEKINPSDPEFTFDDMLELRLHQHKTLVEDIISTAQKELKIENQLSVIVDTWKKMELHYVQHKVI